MIRIRPAESAEVPAVANVLDGAGLALAHERLVGCVTAGTVLVATARSGTILGAIVLGSTERPPWTEILAVAVRTGRRDQGIGSRLVQAARDRHGCLVAEFDRPVGPFYHRLGFRTDRIGPDRFTGWLVPAAPDREEPTDGAQSVATGDRASNPPP